MIKNINRNTNLGIILTLILVSISTALWVSSKVEYFEFMEFEYWNLYAGQFSAILAVTFISLNFILASRLKLVEKLFGGLDKVYVFHKISGRLGYLFALFHPFLLLLDHFGNSKVLEIYLIPSRETPEYAAGATALYLLTFLIGLTVLKILPYGVWKITHKFMGFVLLFVFLHVAQIHSDISNFVPLKVWVFTLLTMAAISYIFREFLYNFSTHKYNYIVKDVSRSENITRVRMKPKSKKLNHFAGQFAFWQFPTISKELHPFTISSSPDSELLEVNVKNLGDFTSQIKNLNVADAVKVFGPYGSFARESLPESEYEVWVAGGIGVTPFLSMLRSTNSKKKVIFIYSTKNASEDFFDEELLQATAALPDVKFVRHYSSTDGWLDARKVIDFCSLEDKGVDISSVNFLICGPRSMSVSLKQQLKKIGVSAKRVFYEEFKFR